MRIRIGMSGGEVARLGMGKAIYGVTLYVSAMSD